MFYIYAIAGPALILILSDLTTTPKPKNTVGYVDLLLKAIPHEIGYSFFLCYLESEKFTNADWTFLTIWLFLIPISVIVFLLKIVFLVKHSRLNRTNK
jgi:hypothetical protein